MEIFALNSTIWIVKRQCVWDRQWYSRSRIPPAFCCCLARLVRWVRLPALASSSYPESRWRRSWQSEDLKISSDMVQWSSQSFDNILIILTLVTWQSCPFNDIYICLTGLPDHDHPKGQSNLVSNLLQSHFPCASLFNQNKLILLHVSVILSKIYLPFWNPQNLMTSQKHIWHKH